MHLQTAGLRRLHGAGVSYPALSFSEPTESAGATENKMNLLWWGATHWSRVGAAGQLHGLPLLTCVTVSPLSLIFLISKIRIIILTLVIEDVMS